MGSTNADLMRVLGRMEGTLHEVKEAFHQHVADDVKVEERVRKVERKQSWFMGGIAASWAFLVVAWNYLTS
jgi:hypothetical protein